MFCHITDSSLMLNVKEFSINFCRTFVFKKKKHFLRGKAAKHPGSISPSLIVWMEKAISFSLIGWLRLACLARQCSWAQLSSCSHQPLALISMTSVWKRLFFHITLCSGEINEHWLRGMYVWRQCLGLTWADLPVKRYSNCWKVASRAPVKIFTSYELMFLKKKKKDLLVTSPNRLKRTALLRI